VVTLRGNVQSYAEKLMAERVALRVYGAKAGNVRSWAERQEAERAAWAAPGVRHVDDRIAVVP
jgi:osmotically-inducible protein OsmY